MLLSAFRPPNRLLRFLCVAPALCPHAAGLIAGKVRLPAPTFPASTPVSDRPSSRCSMGSSRCWIAALPSPLSSTTLSCGCRRVRATPTASRRSRQCCVQRLICKSGACRPSATQAKREVYVLTVVSTNAPGLTPSTPDSRGGGGEQRGGLKLGQATIDWLPGYFEKWLGKPVINETGLTNRYDIRFKWKMSQRELLPGAMDGPDPEAILAAAREQLGLEFVNETDRKSTRLN